MWLLRQLFHYYQSNQRKKSGRWRTIEQTQMLNTANIRSSYLLPPSRTRAPHPPALHRTTYRILSAPLPTFFDAPLLCPTFHLFQRLLPSTSLLFMLFLRLIPNIPATAHASHTFHAFLTSPVPLLPDLLSAYCTCKLPTCGTLPRDGSCKLPSRPPTAPHHFHLVNRLLPTSLLLLPPIIYPSSQDVPCPAKLSA
jgi:hypothetical protein